MNADDLRAVAKEIREKANAATPSPWELGEVFGPYPEEPAIPVHADVEPLIGGGLSVPDAEHIAAWHPAVALAVADWLDDIAESMELLAERTIPRQTATIIWQTSKEKAIAFCKAWRGES